MLHLGNALGAVLTLARARAQGGRCYLRIEDLDRPREKPGVIDAIVADLHDLGLHFDSSCDRFDAGAAIVDGRLWQSRRTEAYAQAARTLIDDGLVYACRCTRKDLAAAASAPHVGEEGPTYPGTCRELGLPLDGAGVGGGVAWRVRVDRLVERFGAPTVRDHWQGELHQDVVADVGDVVIRRKDGLYAYQLAVVVDDRDQGVTEVVRGVDLLSSAPRQALLHQALGNTPPAWAHFPLLVDKDGQKLSKRDGAAPHLLRRALDDVGVHGTLRWLTLALAGDDVGLQERARAVDDIDDVAALLDELPLTRTSLPMPLWPSPG